MSKANAIADYFEIILNTSLPTTNPTFMLLPLSIALCEETYEPFNQPFFLQELKTHLCTLKNTSPGHDKVHNKHLSNLPKIYELWLLDFYNKSFSQSHIPKNWKLAEIIPILKPGKHPTSVSSYRPISLLSCVSKTMEKQICSRMYRVLETGSGFSSTQGGCRKRLCTLDQISRL